MGEAGTLTGPLGLLPLFLLACENASNSGDNDQIVVLRMPLVVFFVISIVLVIFFARLCCPPDDENK
jgi:hypothetical protein